MATFTLSIPDTAVSRVVAALSVAWGVDATPAAVKLALREHLSDLVRRVESQQAIEAERVAQESAYEDPGMEVS